MNNLILPKSSKIDSIKLGRLFDNMSESYKIFWFQAIINNVIEGNNTIVFDDIINEMIANGWYMVNEYKLNLGPSDTLEKVINVSFEKLKLKSSEKKKTIISNLKNNKDNEFIKFKKTLINHVPYRLQAPFLEDIKGNDWYKRDLIDNINSHDNLLYYFSKKNGLNSTITVNEEFVEYILNNQEIINGWIHFKMIEYLQRRNPSVPGIINKIDPPQSRNLEKVKKYWNEIIKISNIHEIYDDEELKVGNISIDHFIPWSYVAHDELWNLSPTTKIINSSKSNHLPNWNHYFKKLSDIEYQAYTLTKKNDKVNQLFIDCSKDHINDLDILNKLYCDGLSQIEFNNRLKEIVEPVYKAAKNLGFTEWSM